MPWWGGIEAGGTKFVCAVGTGPGGLRAVERIPTTTPDETLDLAAEFFQRQAIVKPLTAVGIACFGPLDPDPASPTFGYVTTTPKAGWAHTDVAGIVREKLGVPVGFDTDVNGAVLGEHRWGAARGMDTCLYLTVGTGIGGGALVGGKLVHGLLHPEMGHVRIPHDKGRDPYPGCCPYHGDCLEGMASGPAIEGRWGQRAETLPPEHPAWDLEAQYLALGLCNYICTLSPQRIILGGGVMEQDRLFPLIRRNVQRYLNEYLQSPAILNAMDGYIVPPGLGNQAGVLGAIALAQLVADSEQDAS